MNYTIEEYENNYIDDSPSYCCFNCQCSERDYLMFMYDDYKIEILKYDCEDSTIVVYCCDDCCHKKANIQMINYLVNTYSFEYDEYEPNEEVDIWKHEHIQSLLEILTQDVEYEHMFIYQLLKRNDFDSIKTLNDLGYCSTIENKFNLNESTKIQKNKSNILKYFFELYNSNIKKDNLINKIPFNENCNRDDKHIFDLTKEFKQFLEDKGLSVDDLD